MDVRHLEVFQAVVDAGTATRAAQALGLSQPAVSRNIKQLEKDLGFSLFDRARGRLSPTPEAMRLHAEIVKAFTGIQKVVATARDIGNIASGRLRVAAVPSLAQGLLRQALGAFVKQIPSLTTSFEVRSHRMVVDLVASRGVDIGIGTLPVTHPGVMAEHLCRPRAVCVLPSRHELSKQQTISAEMLDKIDFVTLSRRHNSRHRLDEIFLSAGVAPNIRVDVATAETACSLAAEGVGVTVVNALTARRYAGEDVVIRDFVPEMRYEFGLLYPVKQPRSEITQSFTAHLREFLDQIGEGL